MKKYIVFYYLNSDYDYVYVDAKSFSDASSIAGAFRREHGAIILGICLESLLNNWPYE